MPPTGTSSVAGNRRDMERSPWHARLSMLLIFSLIAQSVLTATCDLDRFRPGEFGVATVAVASPSDSDEAVVAQGVCTQCGGLTTPGGCCAHGIALSQGIPKPLAPHSLLLLAADEATGLAEQLPSDPFRPPILV